MGVRLFEVGGCVRDRILGIPTKDIDFSVEAESFDAMREFLLVNGYTIFVETPHFLTIRAHFPKDHPEHGRTTADFVLCRQDGASLDGRRPESVTPGTIFDDLARRDFTVNAMAIALDTGEFLDPHNGRSDLDMMMLRFVGDPHERIREDALRILRAVRFMVTKGFKPTPDTWRAMGELSSAELLVSVSTERIKEELEKCFRRDTILTMQLLDELDLFEPLFSRAGIRLTTTMRG